MGKERNMVSERYPQYFDDPYDDDEGDYGQYGATSAQGIPGFLTNAKHIFSLTTDAVLVVLGVVACVWLASHVTTVNTSANGVSNTGNVVITTGNASIKVTSSQNAPLTLTGSATPLTIAVTNNGTVPIKVNAQVTASTTALSQALTTSANFCLGATACASASDTSFTGTYNSPVVLAPGQTGTLALMLSAVVSGSTSFGAGQQAVAVTVGGTQA